MDLEKTTNGIGYTWELAGMEGASFILFPEAGHTKKMIAAAIAEIKRERDVVRLRVAREADRDELYRIRIFRHPLAGTLKWYEINDDAGLITKERQKGTTVDDFVAQFVLPFREQTKEKLLKQFGDKIYQL